MQLINDIIAVIKTLSIIDFILYFAVLVLMILIITLIYIIKTENYETIEENQTEKPNLVPTIMQEDNAPIDLGEIDLQQIVNTIDENPKPIVDMTSYEAEQEEKAIISYEELLNSAKKQPIHFDEEELIDNEIKVQKVNLEQLANTEINEERPKLEVKLFQYEHEEAFLKALQQLNEILN